MKNKQNVDNESTRLTSDTEILIENENQDD